MKNEITLKVYNKDNKLNILIKNCKSFKIIIIYKYNRENVDTHTYVIPKDKELNPWQAYYELTVEERGVVVENLMISKTHIEHIVSSEMEKIKTTINLDSGNRYENRIKYFDGEKYETEFKNNKLSEIKFNLQEKKINEYLKILHNGKRKN